MKTPRVYIDTSVIGGCFDEEFRVWSVAFFRDIQKGLFEPLLSSGIAEEIAPAPLKVRRQYREATCSISPSRPLQWPT
jgi:hypothetical protein